MSGVRERTHAEVKDGLLQNRGKGTSGPQCSVQQQIRHKSGPHWILVLNSVDINIEL